MSRCAGFAVSLGSCISAPPVLFLDKFNYFPSRGSAAGTSARPGNGGETQSALHKQKLDSFVSYAQSVHGMKLRAKAPKFLERYDQASLFYNSQTPAEQKHMLAAASFELSKVGGSRQSPQASRILSIDERAPVECER